MCVCVCPPDAFSLLATLTADTRRPRLSFSLSPSLSTGLLKRSAGHVFKDKDYKSAVVTLTPKFEGDTMGWPDSYT